MVVLSVQGVEVEEAVNPTAATATAMQKMRRVTHNGPHFIRLDKKGGEGGGEEGNPLHYRIIY